MQITYLKSVGVRGDRIFIDMMSGTRDEREGLQRLLARAEKGGTVLCTKMVRFGRNTADMIPIVYACYKKEIAFVFWRTTLALKA